MNVQQNETKQEKLTSGTYSGVVVNAVMLAIAVNALMDSAAFNPQMCSLKVLLKRDGRSYTIMQDNLMLLGTFATLEGGYNEFLNGVHKVYPTAAKKHSCLRTVEIPFGGVIRLGNNDTLVIELTSSVGTYSSAVDATSSYIEFYAKPAIGYELFIPSIVSEVVQANTNSQPFSIGNNVLKLAFINFDKNDLENEVISNLNLSSDRFDGSYTMNQLIALKANYFSKLANQRFATQLPIVSGSTGVAHRGMDYLPQSLIIFDGAKVDSELDECRLNVSFNGSYVNPSQNFFMWINYETTIAQIKEATERENKHLNEKLVKLPTA